MLGVVVRRQGAFHLPAAFDGTVHHLPAVDTVIDVKATVCPHELCGGADGLQRWNLLARLGWRLRQCRVGQIEFPRPFLHEPCR